MPVPARDIVRTTNPLRRTLGYGRGECGSLSRKTGARNGRGGYGPPSASPASISVSRRLTPMRTPCDEVTDMAG